MNRQYVTSSADERKPIGDALVGEYFNLADARMNAGAVDEAITLYRKAAVLCGRMRSPRLNEAKRRIESALEVQRTHRNIKRFEQALLRDASDAASAKALTLIYLTELNDPQQAAKYAPRSGDAQLQAMVSLANKIETNLSPADSLKLGEWYENLANQASANRRRPLLDNAKKHLVGVVESSKSQSIQTSKATLLLVRVEKAIEQSPEHATTPTQSTATTPGHTVSNWKVVQWYNEAWNLKPLSAIDVKKLPSGSYAIKRTAGSARTWILLTPPFEGDFVAEVKVQNSVALLLSADRKDRVITPLHCAPANKVITFAFQRKKGVLTCFVDGKVVKPEFYRTQATMPCVVTVSVPSSVEAEISQLKFRFAK